LHLELPWATAFQENQPVTVVARAVLYDQSSSQEGNKLMLRITENSENGKTVTLRLDGTLAAGSYSELETLCSQYQARDGITILLDMAGVVFMNDEVAKKLVKLQSDRLRIINCSPFIETLLQTMDKQDGGS
jgi:anti-anti-sigma regulatory factor